MALDRAEKQFQNWGEERSVPNTVPETGRRTVENGKTVADWWDERVGQVGHMVGKLVSYH
jgi:hypothetical protein